MPRIGYRQTKEHKKKISESLLMNRESNIEEDRGPVDITLTKEERQYFLDLELLEEPVIEEISAPLGDYIHKCCKCNVDPTTIMYICERGCNFFGYIPSNTRLCPVCYRPLKGKGLKLQLDGG